MIAVVVGTVRVVPGFLTKDPQTNVQPHGALRCAGEWDFSCELAAGSPSGVGPL